MITTSEILKEENFEEVNQVAPDSKNRLFLGKTLKRNPDVTLYKVYQNALGQIILDPQITIPATEAWVYKNPSVFRDIQKGLLAADSGEIMDAPEDFSKYADEE